jgi:imidazolonepropionase-like amidohydrolase
VALKRAIDDGMVPGPRLFVATRAIVAEGSYGPAVRQYRPDIDLPQGAQEASGVDGVIAAVRQQAARGADWIKLQTDRRSAAPQPDRNVRCWVARVVAQGTAAFRTGANGENRP